MEVVHTDIALSVIVVMMASSSHTHLWNEFVVSVADTGRTRFIAISVDRVRERRGCLG